MPKTKPSRQPGAALRVRRHRRKLAAEGAARVEVTVPAADASLVRALALQLRAGGGTTRRARETLRRLLRPASAETGAELVAFFRASPLAGADLVIKRDESSGRKVSF